MKRAILLDIDGVLVTTPIWKRAEIASDGFLTFNPKASENLSLLIHETLADVILTTSHRNSYSTNDWKNIFKARGIITNEISSISRWDPKTSNRLNEIIEWSNKNHDNISYVILDDDSMLEKLPAEIKMRWVRTKPLIGLDESARHKSIQILLGTHFEK